MFAKSCVSGLYPLPVAVAPRSACLRMNSRVVTISAERFGRRDEPFSSRFDPRPFAPSGERVQASQVVKVCRKEHVARADVVEGTWEDPPCGRRGIASRRAAR